MKNVLRRVFRSVLPKSGGSAHRLDLRDVARKYGHGNVRILQGRIMSAAEYGHKRDSVLAYEF